MGGDLMAVDVQIEAARVRSFVRGVCSILGAALLVLTASATGTATATAAAMPTVAMAARVSGTVESIPTCATPTAVAWTATAAGASPAFTRQVRVYRPDGTLLATPSAALSTNNSDPISSTDRSVLVWVGTDPITATTQVFASDADGSNPRRVSTGLSTDNRQPAVSADGSLVAWSGNSAPPGSETDVFVASSAGTGTVTMLSPSSLLHNNLPSFSPDGTEIAWIGNVSSGVSHIFVADVDGTDVRDLGGSAAVSSSGSAPAWSGDGTTVAWIDADPANSPWGFRLLVAPRDASSPAVERGTTELPSMSSVWGGVEWSPDGSAVAWALSQLGPTGSLGGQAYSATLSVSAADGSFTRSLGNGARPQWSADGSALAFLRYTYEQNAFGVTETTGIIMLADSTGQNLTSVPVARSSIAGYPHAVDGEPEWRPDGSSLTWSSEIWDLNWSGHGFTYVYSSTRGYATDVLPGPSAPGPVAERVAATTPIWSPDGSMVAWGNQWSRAGVAAHVTAADGSVVHRFDDLGYAGAPVWTLPCDPDPLSGRVTAAASGLGVAGVTVTLMNAWPGWTIAATATTDAAGNYRFVSVAPGTYRLRFYDAFGRYQRQWYASSSTYKTGSNVLAGRLGSPVVIDVALSARATGGLTGAVTDGGSGVLPGIVVQVFGGGSYLGAATTDPNGNYRFDGLPPGSYYVRFVDPSHTYRTEWFVNATRFTVATPVTVGTTAVVADAALAAA